MFDDGTVADLSLDGENALKRGLISNLYGLHEITAQGYTLALIGSTSHNGSTYWEVKKSSPDGFSEHLYLDKDTFMITSDIETSALHPDLDSSKTRQETFRSDYREVAGVLFSHKSEKYNLDTGDIMQTAIVTSREVNIDLDPAQFLRPESTPADD